MWKEELSETCEPPLSKGRGEKGLMKMMTDLGRGPRGNWLLKPRDKRIL